MPHELAGKANLEQKVLSRITADRKQSDVWQPSLGTSRMEVHCLPRILSGCYTKAAVAATSRTTHQTLQNASSLCDAIGDSLLDATIARNI